MDISTVISFITLGAVLIGAITNGSTLIGRTESKAAATAEMKVMLSNIYNKVESIEKKQDSIEETLQKHGERITAVEQSAKSAHHRLDNLEKKE